jgi:hypothetical protein
VGSAAPSSTRHFVASGSAEYESHIETRHLPVALKQAHWTRVHSLPLETVAVNNVLEKLRAQMRETDAVAILGMDAEWQPERTRKEHYPVALLQLAWGDDVFLVRLQHLKGAVPPALYRIMADESITKLGEGIHEDMRRLKRDYGLTVEKAVDMRDVLDGMGVAHVKQQGLASLASRLLGCQMNKAMQRSDWARRRLSRAQATYAATDAWAASKMFEMRLRGVVETEGVDMGAVDWIFRGPDLTKLRLSKWRDMPVRLDRKEQLSVHVLPLDSKLVNGILEELHQNALLRMQRGSGVVLGMGVVWDSVVVPGKGYCVAALALALGSDVYLLRLRDMRADNDKCVRMEDVCPDVPSALCRLLADELIRKISHSMGHDARQLWMQNATTFGTG